MKYLYFAGIVWMLYSTYLHLHASYINRKAEKLELYNMHMAAIRVAMDEHREFSYKSGWE